MEAQSLPLFYFGVFWRPPSRLKIQMKIFAEAVALATSAPKPQTVALECRRLRPLLRPRLMAPRSRNRRPVVSEVWRVVGVALWQLENTTASKRALGRAALRWLLNSSSRLFGLYQAAAASAPSSATWPRGSQLLKLARRPSLTLAQLSTEAAERRPPPVFFYEVCHIFPADHGREHRGLRDCLVFISLVASHSHLQRLFYK